MSITDLLVDQDNVMLGTMTYKNKEGKDVVYRFALELVAGILEDHIDIRG